MILSINEHIAAKLAASASLQAKLGGRCYPIASIEEVAFPLAVYSRLSVNPEYDKSSKKICDTTVAVYVAADSYADSLSIAEDVVSALDKQGGEYDGFSVIDARVIAATEDFNNGAYVQEIDFNFTIKEK